MQTLTLQRKRRKLSHLFGSTSDSELVKEQKSDASLKGLFEQVSPHEDLKNTSQGFLVRKWVPHGDSFLGDPIEVVLPSKFSETALKTWHDMAGHMGIRKTCTRILPHFFWPSKM